MLFPALLVNRGQSYREKKGYHATLLVKAIVTWVIVVNAEPGVF